MTKRQFSATLIIGLVGTNVLVAQDARIPPTRVSERLAIVSSLDQEAFKAGTPVPLKIAARNVHTKPVQIMIQSAEFDYKLTVFDESGNELTRTDFGKWLVERERGGSRFRLTLEPKEEHLSSLDLAKIYRLTKPGTYFARLERVVPQQTAQDAQNFVERTYSWPIRFRIVE